MLGVALDNEPVQKGCLRQKTKLSVKILELRAIDLTLRHFQPQILVKMNNVSARVFINKWVGFKIIPVKQGGKTDNTLDRGKNLTSIWAEQKGL